MEDIEKFNMGVKEALTQLLKSHRVVQDKITDLEGRSRRNNVRIYRVPENTEGPSVAKMVENLIKTELGEKLGLNQGDDLGIEWAHRSLAQQPPVGKPSRRIVVRFLQYTAKEKVLNATWEKRGIYVQSKRMFFDHDYAEEVLKKRKKYIPIKRKLKEKNIHFETPLTRLRAHFSTVTYHSTTEAAEDLTSRGFTFEESFPQNETASLTEDTLHTLLPWRTEGSNRRDAKKDRQDQIRNKLSGFRRDQRRKG